MTIFVDGACSGNGTAAAKGGFGVVVIDDTNDEVITTYSKHNEATTNNREELRAILYALVTYGKMHPITVVYSDSAYAVNSLSTWRWAWARNGWLKSDSKPPENLDLIMAYADLWDQGYRIDLRKCAGHSKIKGNELADELAKGRVKG